jgi:hypothetical protein
MAKRITELNPAASVSGDDLLYLVADPGGTPVSKKIPFSIMHQAGREFYPENFGAVGDGAADDTAPLQAAIDAAEVSGGNVILTRTYRITHGGYLDRVGLVRYVDYGLHINADNVTVIGRGGKLTMTELPTPTNGGAFVLVLFGNGGATDGSIPGDNGTWISRVGIQGVTIDTTVISTETSVLGSYIRFSYCQDFFIDNCTILDGRALRADACIHSNSSSRYGEITRNTIYYPWSTGIMCDGGRYIRIAHNHVGFARGSGVNLQANLDNLNISSYFCVIDSNTISDYGQDGAAPGIALTGSQNNMIANNVMHTSTGGIGVSLQAYSTTAGKAETSRNVVVGNRIRRDNNSGTVIGIKITGSDANAFDGTPLGADDNHIIGNSISGMVLSVQLTNNAKRNSVAGNIFDTTRSIQETAESAIGNMIGANVFGVAAAGRNLEMDYSMPYFRPGTNIMLKGAGYYKLLWEPTQGIMTGTGDPNGVVTAMIGSIYLRRDGGAGSTLYVKESGSSNTGWSAK